MSLTPHWQCMLVSLPEDLFEYNQLGEESWPWAITRDSNREETFRYQACGLES